MSNLNLRAGQKGHFTSAVGKWDSLFSVAAASLHACLPVCILQGNLGTGSSGEWGEGVKT